MRELKIISLLFLLIFKIDGFSQNLREDPKLIEGKLDNGLTYYLYETDEIKDQAVFRLFIKTGSLQETDDQRGLAHFMEHMAFNGTKNFEGNEIFEFLERIGAQFGRDINAHTSYDETIFKLNIPTKEEWVIDSTMSIIHDWIDGISLDSIEIEKERGVVLSEWRSKQNSSQKSQDAFLNVLLNDSRFNERKVIGDTAVLKNFNRKTIKDYYDKWYDPNIMAVAVAGDFNADQVKKILNEKFSGIYSNKTEPSEYKINDYHQNGYQIITDKGTKKIELNAIQLIEPYRDINTEKAFEHYYKKNLLNALFKERLSNLSFENPAYNSATITIGNYFPIKAAILTSVELNPNRIEESIRDFDLDFRQILEYGFTSNEINKIKKQINYKFERELSSNKPVSAGRMIQEMEKKFFYDNAIITRKSEFELTKKYNEIIDSISLLNELKSLVNQEEVQYLLTAGSRRESNLPSQKGLEDLLQKAKKRKVNPYTNVFEVPEKLLASDPTPGQIVSEKNIDAIDAKEIMLSNGVRVVYKQSDLSKNSIILSGFRKGGYYSLEEKEYLNGVYSVPVISLSGYGDFKREALSEFLAGNSAKVTMLTDNTRTGFYGSSDIKDKKSLFQLLFLKWTQPNIETALFNQVKDKVIEGKKDHSPSPEEEFGREVKWALRGKDYITKSSTAEEVDSFLIEDRIVNNYNDLFGEADGYTISLITDLDFEEVKDEVLTYIGGLPSGKEDIKYLYEGSNNLTQNKSIIKKESDSDKATVSLIFQQTPEEEINDYQVDVENTVIKSLLRMKLLKELREEMGAVYSVSVNASTMKKPYPLSRQSISFITSPERVAELIEKTKEIIDDLVYQRASFDKELSKIKTNQIKSNNILKQRNSYWTKAIRDYYFNDYPDWNNINSFEELINGVDEDVISKRMETYFIDSYMLKAILLPKEDVNNYN